MTDETVRGDDGELIERLVRLIRGGDAEPDRLVNTGVFVELAVGDSSVLPGVTYMPAGKEPTPGTVLAQRLETTRRVDADEYLELLAERLREVVDFGVAEDFLIRSLRDHLTEWHRRFADVGATAERRAETRRGMLETADDPEQLARYRDRLAESDPQYREMPLDDVATHLRDMVARTLPEPDADEAASRWADLERWQHDLDEWLSDAAFEAWNQKRFLRRSP